MDRSTISLIFVLGTLCALGPIAIDMYLPALPLLARDLAATDGTIQHTVMAFFLGVTVGQPIYGPASDRLGRKPIILFGLVIFIMATLGCVFASNAASMIALRFLQGLAGAMSMTIPMAIVRDKYTGIKATQLISMIILVLGASPILAPLIGSVILQGHSWRAIFAVIVLYGIITLALVALLLPETNPAEKRHPTSIMAIVKNYARLLIDRSFIPVVLVIAFIQAGFFAYLAASSFVFISFHKLSPSIFAIIFACNAVGLIGAAQLASVCVSKLGPATTIRIASLVYLLCGGAMLAAHALGHASLIFDWSMMFACICMMGLAMPAGSALAMQSQGKAAGAAAALMGTIQCGFGAIASALVGAFANGTPVPLAATLAVCGFGAVVMAWLLLPRTPHWDGATH